MQAHGAAIVRLGDTTVLATAVMSPGPREGGDFFPLTVEYEEKYYAAGRILGSRFIKRETRPSEEAILADRLIDRSIRPRFDMRLRNEVQVVITVLSIDEENDPDIPALLAASLALSLSDIPWSGPIAGVRIGKRTDSEGREAFIANPAYAERGADKLDVVISGTHQRINMIEAGVAETPEEEFARSVEWGFTHLKELIRFQEDIIKEHPVIKRIVPLLAPAKELEELIKREFSERIEKAMYDPRAIVQESPITKTVLDDGAGRRRLMGLAINTVKREWLARTAELYPDAFKKAEAEYLFEEEINAIIHRNIMEHNKRPDGRRADELRELHAAVGLVPRVHGSGLFMRGETHVLSTLTLGSPGDEQIIEGMEIRAKKHFLHHYNFPPFSTGEVKPMRGPGRREIGHGALAGRAIAPLLPPKEEFPYTIRVVSEVLSSNGSSSMASVCASSLCLMDGGVAIKKLAAGAAMGLVLDETGKYRVLTDIQGPEDHHGDMDFKVAGTRDGITAVQMDVKIEGITFEMLRDTLRDAHTARLHILEFMQTVMSEPRPELSPYAPRINIIKINPEKIGALIGPGGKVINQIIADTGVQIDIEDDGTVYVTSSNEEGMQSAMSLIKQITRELKPGELIEGRVTRLFDFGAMVEIGPRTEGLIHISELAPWHVAQVDDILKVGDVVPVMVKNIDEQGRINLSLKDVPGRYTEEEIARGRQERDHAPRPPQREHPSRPRGQRPSHY